MLNTRLTDLFGLEHPLISAPMSRHSGGRLAGAVSRAGGLGLFGGTNPAGASWLRTEIVRAREICAGRPFGVGFITHLIPTFPDLFEVALEERMPVIAFSFADPSPWVARAKDAGARVLCQVQDVRGAAEAVRAGADALVVQGNEAGGHTGEANLLPLLQRVVRDYPEKMVLAAGGIASGRSLAAVLAAGADGAWIGTALLATHECTQVSENYKRALIAARSEDTVYTKVVDVLDEPAFAIPPWPPSIAARLLRNSLTDRWHGAEAELRERLGEVLGAYRSALDEGDVSQMAVLAGESVDFVERIRPAAEVIQEIARDAECALRSYPPEPALHG